VSHAAEPFQDSPVSSAAVQYLLLGRIPFTVVLSLLLCHLRTAAASASATVAVVPSSTAGGGLRVHLRANHWSSHAPGRASTTAPCDRELADCALAACVQHRGLHLYGERDLSPVTPHVTCHTPAPGATTSSRRACLVLAKLEGPDKIHSGRTGLCPSGWAPACAM